MARRRYYGRKRSYRKRRTYGRRRTYRRRSFKRRSYPRRTFRRRRGGYRKKGEKRLRRLLGSVAFIKLKEDTRIEKLKIKNAWREVISAAMSLKAKEDAEKAAYRQAQYEMRLSAKRAAKRNAAEMG